MIEQLDDIIEDLANKIGVYGAHPEENTNGHCNCRCCWTSQLRARIEQAVKVERKLTGRGARHS
jgi:hypothetical protein